MIAELVSSIQALLTLFAKEMHSQVYSKSKKAASPMSAFVLSEYRCLQNVPLLWPDIEFARALFTIA